MYAVQGGSVEIFNRLFELGVDPLATDAVRAVCMYCVAFCVCLCCSYLASTNESLNPGPGPRLYGSLLSIEPGRLLV